MVNRFIRALLFIPVLLLTAPAEFTFYSLRWIITGKEFGNPICMRLIEPKTK